MDITAVRNEYIERGRELFFRLTDSDVFDGFDVETANYDSIALLDIVRKKVVEALHDLGVRLTLEGSADMDIIISLCESLINVAEMDIVLLKDLLSLDGTFEDPLEEFLHIIEETYNRETTELFYMIDSVDNKNVVDNILTILRDSSDEVDSSTEILQYTAKLYSIIPTIVPPEKVALLGLNRLNETLDIDEAVRTDFINNTDITNTDRVYILLGDFIVSKPRLQGVMSHYDVFKSYVPIAITGFENIVYNFAKVY